MAPSKEDLRDLVGPYEIAEALGVDLRLVRAWIRRQREIGSPQPVLELHDGRIYSLVAWRSWAALWRMTNQAEVIWLNTAPPPPKPYLVTRRNHEDIPEAR